jgi:CBS domain-containing protein
MDRKVKEIMTTPVITIKPTDNLELTYMYMRDNKIKRLVVVDPEQNDKCVGVISLSHLNVAAEVPVS